MLCGFLEDDDIQKNSKTVDMKVEDSVEERDDKEQAIRAGCEYENEAPCTLDFILLYMRLTRLQIQDHMQYSDQVGEFLLDVQTIAYDICKSVTLDASMLKYKPSVLAACMVFIGF